MTLEGPMATDETKSRVRLVSRLPGAVRAPRQDRVCIVQQTSRGPAAGPSTPCNSGSPGPSGLDELVERLEALQRDVEPWIDGDLLSAAAQAHSRLALVRSLLLTEKRRRIEHARQWSGLWDEGDRS